MTLCLEICCLLFCIIGLIALSKMLNVVSSIEEAFRDCVTELITCRGCVREDKKH